jgi:LacI family repressor for deo operon, udp, cdd, tsx, nupC, and nupG
VVTGAGVIVVAKAQLPLVHQEVKAALRERLMRDWPAGKRLPPIKQLARELGAGQNNTHRAVKELVAEGLLMSRPRRGTFVSQTGGRNSSQALLRQRQVVIIRGNREPFLDPVIHAISQALEQQGATVSVDLSQGYDAQRHARGDALVLINASANGPLAWPRHRPAVIIDTALDTAIGMPDGYDIVSVDGEHGGHLAGQHLRQIGVASACFVGAGGSSSGQLDQTAMQRLRGFESGFQKPVADTHRYLAEHYMPQCGAQAFAWYRQLPDRPTGVFCASDDLAVGFVHGGLAMGMEAGRDYQLVGFDGQSRGQELPTPLTTIQAPMARMGQVAAEMLIERVGDIDQPVRRVYLGCSLLQGKTTTPAP